MTGEECSDRDGSHDADDFEMYLGPYEAWNFGDGRGYALPLLRKYSNFYTALAEVNVAARGQGGSPFTNVKGWLPTLWKDPANFRFIPFVAYRPFDKGRRVPAPKTLARLLLDALLYIKRNAEPAGSAGSSAGFFPSRSALEKSRFRVAFPVADRAMHEEIIVKPSDDPDWYPDEGLRERIGADRQITVIAVIDDGLPFAHSNFRDKTGKRSRVEFCWLQSVAIDPNQKSVLFGREYTRNTIEDLIARHGDDEDTLYRSAGATEDTEELGSLIDRHGTHGAHVMDLAAGYAPERVEAPREEIRIIAVQLPNTIAWDTSGFGKDMYMLAAFHYIFNRADIIAKHYRVKNLRLVINFSYGFSGGRHDGETELEAAIDELVEKRRKQAKCPTALVLPAGNTFLDRLHGLICPEDFVHSAATFYWRIQPNDRTSSYLELWFHEGFDPHDYRIELYDPTGEKRSEFKIETPSSNRRRRVPDPGHSEPIQNAQKQHIGRISVDFHRAGATVEGNSIGRYRVLIVVAATEPEVGWLPRAEAGKWKVVIRHGVHLIDQPIHCWIQRSTDPESLRSGSRQSYFDDAAFERKRFTPQGDLAETDTKIFVRRFASLNGLATGYKALVVGGFRLGAGLGSSLANARPSRYSSAGVLQSQLCDPSLKKANASYWPEKQVNASSMSDRSRALPGTIAAGVRSGSLSLVQGTSAAAPFVARQLAEIFAEEKNVPAAPNDNYLSLLSNYQPANGRAPLPIRNSLAYRDDPELIKARLGEVLVPPNRQPGVE